MEQSTAATCWAASLATARKVFGGGDKVTEDWWLKLAATKELCSDDGSLGVKGLIKVLEVSGIIGNCGVGDFSPEGFLEYWQLFSIGAVIMLDLPREPGHALIWYAIGARTSDGHAKMRIFDPAGKDSGDIEYDTLTLNLKESPKLTVIFYD